MSDAKFIEACIPDSLRLAEHQDAALVNEAIATTLMAYRKALRDNVWEKNIAADINRAMTAYMEGTYVPHISKENEDWSKLQLEAEEARVMKAAQAEVAKPVEPIAPVANTATEGALVIVSSQEYSKGVTQYNGELTLSNGAGPYGTTILTRKYGSQWKASVYEMGETKGKGEGASEREAMNSAAMAAGYSLSGELP